MNNEINIKAGEYAVADKGSVIFSVGVGSCVVICLYDLISGLGCMSHSMLPKNEMNYNRKGINNIRLKENRDPKFVDEAVGLLISKMMEKGAKLKNIKAKIVGGASLFKTFDGKSSGMGQRNINMAKNELKKKNIPIINEDTGGNIGRMVEFIVADGCVIVSTKTVL